mmetsp:Transcript_22698/g.40850  ORF Transcript_22698/g.40850 Transcript_22698/m.40850 type:complete len:92 (+) Transcript_22698:549-824(+)
MEQLLRSAQADNAMLKAHIQQLKTKLGARKKKPKAQTPVMPKVEVVNVVKSKGREIDSAPCKLRKRCFECESLLIAGHSSVGCKKHWKFPY